jgi:hypothetical protein
MKRNIIYLTIIASVFLSGCASTVEIFSDVDESGAFESYISYNFMAFTEGNNKTITGMELERIKVAFAREIELRGLRFAEVNADVSIQIIVYHRQAMSGGYYHPTRYNYMERAITVDMYDNLTQKHVWHCAAVGELEYDANLRAQNLPELVSDIFGKYPVQLASDKTLH